MFRAASYIYLIKEVVLFVLKAPVVVAMLQLLIGAETQVDSFSDGSTQMAMFVGTPLSMFVTVLAAATTLVLTAVA